MPIGGGVRWDMICNPSFYILGPLGTISESTKLKVLCREVVWDPITFSWVATQVSVVLESVRSAFREPWHGRCLDEYYLTCVKGLFFLLPTITLIYALSLAPPPVWRRFRTCTHSALHTLSHCRHPFHPCAFLPSIRSGTLHSGHDGRLA